MRSKALQTNLSEIEQSARNGDAEAFGDLIREFDNDLRGVAWSVSRDSVAVDDIMQDTYEKSFRSIKKFDGRSTLKTWLHSICYRTALDYVRHSSYRRHESIDMALDAKAPDATDETAIRKNEIQRTLAKLPPDQRALLMLTSGLGFTFDETAEITGIRRGTVASKVGRARQRLREQKS